MMPGKEISILGAAKSGIGVAILAKKVGYNVFVSDYNIISDENKKELSQLGVDWEEGGHTIERLLKAEEIVKSPGIPDSAKLIQKLKKENIPIISEIEFAGRFSNGIKICVTGSNGKTTTTLMLKHILEKAGLDVEAVGNVGKSYAKVLSERDHDFFVIELSSFQLDYMHAFKADIAIILNITPDHLDRYENDFQKYIDSKFRILNNQNKSEVLIYNSDDPIIEKEIKKRQVNSSKYGFSQSKKKWTMGHG